MCGCVSGGDGEKAAGFLLKLCLCNQSPSPGRACSAVRVRASAFQEGCSFYCPVSILCDGGRERGRGGRLDCF